MRSTPLVFVVFAGCGFQVSTGASPDDGPDANLDAGRDGAHAAPDAPTYGCYGTGLVKVCLTAPAPPLYEVTAATLIDTTADPRCVPVTGEHVANACVIVAEQIKINAPFMANGTRALVLVATMDLEITADTSVASHRGGIVGAGADLATCAPGQGAVANAGGGGGGAGASFTGSGGRGGGPGGLPGQVRAAPDALRGGCRGGGGGDYVGSGGRGGRGGGAVVVIAADAINVSASINASGEGGSGGAVSLGGGGGGGGSGGMLVIDAPRVTISGNLYANGGGGGEGADNAVAGADGGDPSDAAVGGSGGAGAALNVGGGDGGRGAAGDVRDGAPGAGKTAIGAAGAGGGGGGGGYIQILATTKAVSGLVSPPLSP